MIVGCRRKTMVFFFFFNDTATTEIYTLSLHDALPISLSELQTCFVVGRSHRARIPAEINMRVGLLHEDKKIGRAHV